VMSGVQDFPIDTGIPAALDPGDYDDSEVRR
jgi:hypothetical protein